MRPSQLSIDACAEPSVHRNINVAALVLTPVARLAAEHGPVLIRVHCSVTLDHARRARLLLLSMYENYGFIVFTKI